MNTNLSTSQLVKMSLKQLLYFKLNNIQKPVTQAMLDGNDFAQKLINEQNFDLIELGTYHPVKGMNNTEIRLYFSVDAIDADDTHNHFYEIKSNLLENTPEGLQRYLEKSILQATLYNSLLMSNINTPQALLSTSEFYLKENPFVQKRFLTVDNKKENRFYLLFGDNKTFEVFYDQKVLNHYIAKAQILWECMNVDPTEAYDKASKYDAHFKNKEYSILRPKVEEVFLLPINTTVYV